MAAPRTITIFENTQVTRRDQFYREDTLTFYVRDDIYYASAKVFDENGETPTLPIYSETLVIDTAFFDTPQTDSGWTADDVGYNFKWTAPSVAFPEGGHTYRVEIHVATTSDSDVESVAPHVRVFYVKTRGTSA